MCLRVELEEVLIIHMIQNNKKYICSWVTIVYQCCFVFRFLP